MDGLCSQHSDERWLHCTEAGWLKTIHRALWTEGSTGNYDLEGKVGAILGAIKAEPQKARLVLLLLLPVNMRSVDITGKLEK